MFSNRIKNMTPSMTVELTDKLEDLKRQGIDVIRLNIGEPDFNTPKNIVEAGKKALEKGFTRYTQVSGDLGLREAICRKFQHDNNIEYTPDEIIVTTGAKQALNNVLLSLCDKGDEVILPTPCWVSYIEMVKLTEATPILVSLEKNYGFSLNVNKLKDVVNEKTKAILINTPNNPTGEIYSRQELQELGELAAKYDFYIIADEIYEKLIYDGARHVSIASLSKEIRDRTITINGFSKTYAMTGWRLGYAAGPQKIIKAMCDLQGHMTSAPNSIAQMSAIEALLGSQNQTEYMINKYSERREYLLRRINNIEGFNCKIAKGAFYLMPDISDLIGKKYREKILKDSIDVADFLLEEAHVAVVPGIAFHAPNYIRIAYCNSVENIKIGMDRIEKALKLLKED